MIAKFRIGQQVQIRQSGNLATIHGAIIPDYGDDPLNKESVRYAVTYPDGSRSEIDSFDEDELTAVGEKPDMSLVMQEQIQRKVLAIHSLTGVCYPEGTKVLILEGKEVSLLATKPNGERIESVQLAYRIINFSEDSANYLYNHPQKVYGFGMVLVTPTYGWENHTVLVNDNLPEEIAHYGDIPF